ncbi:hypothetical protein M8494_19895 [Serratia ureilytica]
MLVSPHRAKRPAGLAGDRPDGNAAGASIPTVSCARETRASPAIAVGLSRHLRLLWYRRAAERYAAGARQPGIAMRGQSARRPAGGDLCFSPVRSKTLPELTLPALER